MNIKNKKILIGVSASIAAYKVATLIRLLVKEEAEVKVIMTDASKSFITPLTLSTLSKNPVLSSFVKNDSGEWNNHVDLGLWADLLIIAPASANTIAKCANGICDNLLTAVYLSAKCPVFFAPAMDLDMFLHPSTKNNILKLESYGNTIIDAAFGELASGLEGKGRMEEPENIIEILKLHFTVKGYFNGKSVLITAGPTQEDIDPVRYISNHSSGKMGYEIAKGFRNQGANVTLVSGPVSLPSISGIQTINVRSANDMFLACSELVNNVDIVIFAAAVADYTPESVSKIKLKKSDNDLFIPLKKTTDIALSLGQNKKPNQVFVGFALETNQELENAKSKLTKKNFNLIVLNSLQDSGAGFRFDTNQITVISDKGFEKKFELKSKTEVAQDIIDVIEKYVNQ